MVDPDAVLAALLSSDGDDRLAVDPVTGWNKYFCPPVPWPDHAGFSSCTASPVSAEGFAAAASAWRRVERTSVAEEGRVVAAALSAWLGVTGLAEVRLAASGTDATLLAMRLLLAEQPGRPITSVMAAASETGSGIPLAASGRVFFGPATGRSAGGFPPGMATVTIALREASGAQRPSEDVAADFARAIAAVRGRSVAHVIDCSKTGIVAPVRVPDGAEAIVDACQARLSPERIRLYLRRGWPVVITGSKFYGGPAFSGAVLFPTSRLPQAGCGADVALGAVLRWSAALDEMARFALLSSQVVTARMQSLGAEITDRIAACPGLVPVALADADDAEDWADGWPPSIFPFALRADAAPLRSLPALQATQRALADDGVLVGQPVAMGATHGVLRIAIGARTLRDPAVATKLDRLFDTLGRVRQCL